MRPAPAHPDESRRLAALRDLNVLDTAAEPGFDRLTELATIVTGSPIALVTLVDEHRQWFKSKVGINADETARDASFCAHAIVGEDDMLVVDDALADPRFADNPFVIGAPHVRSYAGQVVRDASGLPMGTVCVVDRVSRVFDDQQRRALALIGSLVERELQRVDVAAVSNGLQEELEAALRRSERFARVTLDALDQGTILAERGGRIRRLNPAAERILGYSGEELTELWRTAGFTVSDAHGRELPLEERPVARAVLSGQPVRENLVGWHRKDGKRVLLRLTVVPNVDDTGAVVIGFTDVTAEHDTNRLLDATLEMAPVGLAIIDSDCQVVRCNATFADHAGRHHEDLTGADLLSLLSPEDPAAMAPIADAIRTGRRRRSEVEQRASRPDGSEMWVSTHLAVITDIDPPLAIAATFDVTERKRMILERERLASQLAHRASHDTLTDLMNRGALESKLADSLQRAADGAGVGVCFIDLDNFKAVNDTFGHARGDELLVAIANRIRHAVRGSDVAARMGGDEFVVLLAPVVGPAEAIAVASRIRDRIVDLARTWGGGVSFGASVGVAISASGDTPSTLLSRADAALYRAKSYGGSAIEIDDLEQVPA